MRRFTTRQTFSCQLKPWLLISGLESVDAGVGATVDTGVLNILVGVGKRASNVVDIGVGMTSGQEKTYGG